METSGGADYKDWREFAECRSEDPEIFFSNEPSAVIQAKFICQACEVTDECLQYAIETNQNVYTWGGKTESERRMLRRRWLADQRRNARAS